MINDKMHKVKILVCCHKPDKWLSDDIYMPIQCGKAISDLDLGIQGDDTGDNISAKNPNYCELTALYWAWKNLKDIDYIGLCHYRRYFDSKTMGLSVRFVNENEIFSCSDLLINNDSLTGKDVILPKSWSLPHSVWTDFLPTVLYQDLYVLYKVVQKYYPAYLNAFEKYMFGNKRIGYNMFIMRYDIFQSYSEWLFDILKLTENHIITHTYTSYKRALAFMGELLLPIYCYANNLNIGNKRIAFCSDLPSRKYTYGKKLIKNVLCDTSFFFEKLGNKDALQQDYWELYLKKDNIFISQ